MQAVNDRGNAFRSFHLAMAQSINQAMTGNDSCGFMVVKATHRSFAAAEPTGGTEKNDSARPASHASDQGTGV